MSRTLKLGNVVIGEGLPPYIVAEISCNHMGSLDRAKEIIHAAKQAGADAVKIQTYTADTLTMDAPQEHFKIEHPLWKDMTLHELYAKAQTPFEWVRPLFDYAAGQGIPIFSAPFDLSAAGYLEAQGNPFYKIASFEIVHIPLIEKVASFGKPLIISTGMASLGEIETALSAARGQGCGEIVLLHCVSAYPTPVEEANLMRMVALCDKFGVLTGLSDHTKSSLTARLAVGLGACLVEKHLMLSANDDSFDKAFSLLPDEFAELVSVCKKQAGQKLEIESLSPDERAALGKGEFTTSESEGKSAFFRPSIMVSRDIGMGEIFSPDNIVIRRPSAGLAPVFWNDVIGQPAMRALKRGDALTGADFPAQTARSAKGA